MNAAADPQLPASCPIIHDAISIQGHTRATVRAIRRIRRGVENCVNCSAYDTCPLLANLNESIQTALTEVMDEWQSSREGD